MARVGMTIEAWSAIAHMVEVRARSSPAHASNQSARYHSSSSTNVYRRASYGLAS
jgi:hypothetical protein